MGRLWSWWDELFFRSGDRLVRLERRGPKLYRSSLFLGSWALFTVAAHYLGLFAGATHHVYSWAGAAAIGGLLSLICFAIAR